MAGPVEAGLRQYYDAEMAERSRRRVPPERVACREAFLSECRRRVVAGVLEVGCGAGRDGLKLVAGGLDYVGLDLSLAAVAMCRERGLDAVQGLAGALPFRAATFDAVWSMSTLMHLPGDGMSMALGEVKRVVRRGGMFEVGVWGATEDRERIDEGGRYFCLRSDEALQDLLSAIGTVEDFATWDWFDDGGHYQWARISL